MDLKYLCFDHTFVVFSGYNLVLNVILMIDVYGVLSNTGIDCLFEEQCTKSVRGLIYTKGTPCFLNFTGKSRIA